jgi:hypothetical protein
VNGGNQGFGTRLDLAPCNGTAAQVFLPEGFPVQISPSAATSGTPYVDVHGGDTTGTPPGTPLDIAQTNGTAAQYFTFRFSDGAPAGYGAQIQAYEPYGGSEALCVSWQLGQKYNPSLLVPCDGVGGMYWNLSTANQFMNSAYHSWCLDVLGANWTSGTPLDVTGCNNTDAQAWNVHLVLPQ